MNEQEFSLEFDLLYNNIMSNQAPGLNEYEKSLFLTEAQESVVLDIYSGKLDDSFESTEEVTSYLSPIVKQVSIVPEEGENKITDNSVFCTLPEDVWFKTFEKVLLEDESLMCHESSTREADVVPVTQDTLYRTINSPFRRPNERRVLRLDIGTLKVELISYYTIKSYILRYLAHPEPIILENLSDGLSINGKTESQTCQLNSALHRAILSRAVNIAKAVWESNNKQ